MRTYFILFFLATAGFLQAQTSLTGVVQSKDNQPLLGAYIENVSSNTHSHSNELGSFILENAELGDSIVISHIGFAKLRFTIESFDETTYTLEYASLDLKEIRISRSLDPFNMVSKMDVAVSPVASSQEVLSKVPGLFIGQHAGGGKAEQIFLRGFDIDHGTDLAITVDGMPVNMVSHAHGQGYADLHFVIPETVNSIDFGKGPYDGKIGNFGTAGYVNLRTKDRLNSSLVKMEYGMFNTKRIVSLLNILPNKQNQYAYAAMEYKYSDGPFESSQNFNRANAMAKYVNYFNGKQKLTLSGSYFTSRWDASGQIPMRAVESGMISRFGAIDDTEGGVTSRGNLQMDYFKQISPTTYFKSNAYYSNYSFLLFSNFTFFLEDSVNGDQIKQAENRNLYGINSSLVNRQEWNGFKLISELGVGLRQDVSKGNELTKTIKKVTNQYYINRGNINETNLSTFADFTLSKGNWSINPSIRADEFIFIYDDLLLTQPGKSAVSKAVVSPKFKATYALNNTQFYFKTGVGFHSNDTRTVQDKTNQILPRAFGNDLGLIYQRGAFLINAAVWDLKLEQEFVYVGDAGIVEPSGRSYRKGLDLGVRWNLLDHFFISADGTYTEAQSVDDAEGQNFIPLAPKYTGVFRLGVENWNNWKGSISGRYLGDRPANEDNSIVAEGYTVVDANVNYTWDQLSLGIQVQNALNVEWIETQFATESRLRNETQSVEEIHFTPGAPFFGQLSISYSF